MALYLAALERMRSRSATTLLPSHGPMIRDGHGKLTEYLAHRRMREQRVIDALAGARRRCRARRVVYATPACWGFTVPVARIRGSSRTAPRGMRAAGSGFADTAPL
jgi:glyoxylase-like metal-dependent hydrolase (beta-lactamase superfamily II)